MVNCNGSHNSSLFARVREGNGGMGFDTFTSDVVPVKTTDVIQVGADAGATYAITSIPGLAYDLDPLRLYEERIVGKPGN
jgi:hypothetical protein